MLYMVIIPLAINLVVTCSERFVQTNFYARRSLQPIETDDENITDNLRHQKTEIGEIH